MEKGLVKVEIVKAEVIKAEDYGLEIKKGNEIEQSFGVNDVEINALIKVYKGLVNSEITEEAIEQWNRLSIDLSHANGALNKTHKAQKSFFLNGGRFADDCKKIRSNSIDQMQVVATSNKKHFENLELERIAKLQESRVIELESYDFTPVPGNIGEMEESVYKNFVSGVKLGFDAKKKADEEAEKERLEKERIDNLHFERYNECSPLRDYFANIADFALTEFGKLSDIEYSGLLSKVKKAKTAYEQEQEEIKKENNKLKKEAKEKEDRDKKRNDELRPYIVRIRDYTKLLNSKEVDYQKELADIRLGIKQEVEFEARQRNKQIAEAKKREAEAVKFLKANGFTDTNDGMNHVEYSHFIGSLHYSGLESNEELEVFKADVLNSNLRSKESKELEKLKAKAKLEAKEKADKIAANKAAQQAPDKDKLVKLINELSIEDPKLTTTEAKAAYNVILAKFNGFKTWATQQVDSIK